MKLKRSQIKVSILTKCSINTNCCATAVTAIDQQFRALSSAGLYIYRCPKPSWELLKKCSKSSAVCERPLISSYFSLFLFLCHSTHDLIPNAPAFFFYQESRTYIIM